VFSRTAIAFKEEEGKRVGKRDNNGKKRKADAASISQPMQTTPVRGYCE